MDDSVQSLGILFSTEVLSYNSGSIATQFWANYTSEPHGRVFGLPGTLRITRVGDTECYGVEDTVAMR
jgi:hypothetical protein